MKIYLAATIGFWVLTNSSVATTLSAGSPPVEMHEAGTTQSGSAQEPAQTAQPTSPTQDTPQPAQETAPEKTGSEKTGSEKSAPEQPPQAPIAPPPSPTQEPQPPASTKKPEPAAKSSARKHRRRKHVTTKPAATGKKVVRNGGTADPAAQLAPGVSNEQASRQRRSTTELLATTDTNLKQLASRELNKTQQDSVSQIRKYMEQAKTAEETGDVQRAQNLASKALMLSDDLVKH
jgi:hypothetical protein